MKETTETLRLTSGEPTGRRLIHLFAMFRWETDIPADILTAQISGAGQVTDLAVSSRGAGGIAKRDDGHRHRGNSDHQRPERDSFLSGKCVPGYPAPGRLRHGGQRDPSKRFYRSGEAHRGGRDNFFPYLWGRLWPWRGDEPERRPGNGKGRKGPMSRFWDFSMRGRSFGRCRASEKARPGESGTLRQRPAPETAA